MLLQLASTDVFEKLCKLDCHLCAHTRFVVNKIHVTQSLSLLPWSVFIGSLFGEAWPASASAGRRADAAVRWKELSAAITEKPAAADESGEGFKTITQEVGIGHDAVWKTQVEDFQNKSFNSESSPRQLHHPSESEPHTANCVYSSAWKHIWLVHFVDRLVLLNVHIIATILLSN